MYDAVGTIDAERVRALAVCAGVLDLCPGPEGYRATPFEPTRDRFMGLLRDALPGVWTYAVIVALAPGAQLGAHVDGPIRGVRRHLVLQTNPGCWSFHDGAWQHLTLGGLYAMDPTFLHGAVNWGEQPRLHLIVDR